MNLVGCKAAIIKRLREAGKPLASFEFNAEGNIGYSENCICTRCSELAKAGLIVGSFRKGKNFKEWGLVGQVEMFSQRGAA